MAEEKERGGGWALERLSPCPRAHWGKNSQFCGRGRERGVSPAWFMSKYIVLLFHSLPDWLLEVLMTADSQNNTQRYFFQLRSAESCYLPISHWRPPRALVIPGSPRPECDPTGRFPRHLERTSDVPCQLTGLLTASFQREPGPSAGLSLMLQVCRTGV